MSRWAIVGVWTAGGLVLGPLAAPASDGVLEINQACATSGCFAGDTAGFPVTITTAAGVRSFRLTSDLAPAFDATGILIGANDVTIDLNGFAIRGRPVCIGSCPTLGHGVAIDRVLNPDPARTEVRNGSVVYMPENGIELGATSVVRHVRAAANVGDGIVLGAGSAVSESTASDNGLDGIQAANDSRIWGNTVSANGNVGLRLGDSAAYGGNVVNGNAQGTVVGPSGLRPPVNVGGNSCDDTPTCP